MISQEHVKKGKLVYIPSGVRLVMRGASRGVSYVSEWVDTEKPTNCIITSDNVDNNLCEILYCGKKWYVKVSDTYAVQESSNELKGERYASNPC